MNFDFARICDSIEVMPDLSVTQVWTELQTLRKLCRALSDDAGDIDPRDIEKTNTIDPVAPDDPLQFLLAEELSDTHSHALLLIPRLLRTPRALKTRARQTYDAWRRLHGEVDFDDLLVCHVVRSVNSEAFTFVVRNYRHFCLASEGPKHGSRPGAKDQAAAVAALKACWDTELNSEPERSRNDLWTLLGFVFDGLDKGMITRQAKPPQGIATEQYWSRVARRGMDKAVPDQRVIRDLSSWKAGRSYEPLVVGLAHDDDYATTFERVQSRVGGLRSDLRLDASELRSLASAIFEVLLKEQKAEATMGRSSGRADEMIASSIVWKLYRQRHASSAGDAAHTEWVRSEVLKAIRVSLRLAIDIAYYWGSARNEVMVTQADATTLRREMAQVAKEQWDPQRLCAILGHYSSSLFQFVTGGHEGELQENWPRDWEWLGLILIGALKRCPVTVVPSSCQLLSSKQARLELLPKQTTPALVSDVGLSRETLNAITKQNNRRQFLQTLIEQIPAAMQSNEVGDEDKAVIASIRDFAHSVLSARLDSD